MRIAEICPTCATYINASCIIYDGPYLSNIDVSPLDPLDQILGSINNNLVPVVGIIAPTTNATYVGQLYVNTVNGTIYYAITTGAGAADWVAIVDANDFPPAVNLQSVLTAGNIATNRNIIMNGNSGYQIYLNGTGSNSYIRTTGTSGIEITSSEMSAGGFFINNNTTNFSLEITANGSTIYSDGVNTLEVFANPINYNNNSLTYPSGTGTFAISVNGIAADSTGDVDLGGYSGNIVVGLQTLTFTNGILTSVV